LSDGLIRCWGANTYGELGNDDPSDTPVPTLVKGIADVVSVVAGSENTCAIVADGTVSCWGKNNSRQLGERSVAVSSSVPVVIQSALPASAVAVGETHICTITRIDASVQCWGSTEFGALGNGTTAAGTVATPWTVPGLKGATTIAAGARHTCASVSDGHVLCWGDNSLGQLGRISGSSTSTGTPQSVTLSDGTPAVLILQVSSIQDHVCAALGTAQAQCWGQNGSGQLGSATVSSGSRGWTATLVGKDLSGTPLQRVAFMVAGREHSCALVSDGTAFCWGLNDNGQLGIGNVSNSNNPREVSLSTVQALSAGARHTCAILKDGTAWCWGQNAYRQLGDGSNVDLRALPVKVEKLLP
jgi:alpha-tubulin suppressor-like RCC1 family protein